mmetsp:Transcript_2024/g.5340  ORF Transcript_2024/g.5340 Transcript_2024/m.5340 type:complete len:269 (-) Transcript_2024:1459-2265(-)
MRHLATLAFSSLTYDILTKDGTRKGLTGALETTTVVSSAVLPPFLSSLLLMGAEAPAAMSAEACKKELTARRVTREVHLSPTYRSWSSLLTRSGWVRLTAGFSMSEPSSPLPPPTYGGARMRSWVRRSMKPDLRSWQISAESTVETTTTWTGLARSSTCVVPFSINERSLTLPPQLGISESIHSVQRASMGSHTRTCTRAAIWLVAHMASISVSCRWMCMAAVSCSDCHFSGPWAWGRAGGDVSHSIVVPLPAPTVFRENRTRHRSAP